MNRLLAILISTFLFSTVCVAQVGNPFPELSAENVEDIEVSIPDDTNGKYTLVGLAYSKKAEDDLSTWYTPIYNKFVKSSEDAGIFAAFTYDINVYFIPMFTGIKAAAQGTAKNKTLKLADERLWPHILFYKGSLKPYEETLNFDKKKVPYFFVLDDKGVIRYATSGAFSREKMGEIEEVIE